MNKAMITFVLCCCMISCIKDEAPNNECDIESAWVEGAELEKLVPQRRASHLLCARWLWCRQKSQ